MLAVSDEIDPVGVECCLGLIRRGVLTHDALPERTFERLVQKYDVVQEMADAYGYTAERMPKFIPTPKDVSNMLPVWYWLNDLRHQVGTGRRDFKLLVARARGTCWWKLEGKFYRCERQLRRWHDAAVAWIYLANREEVLRLG
jgi:hypothetical protein